MSSRSASIGGTLAGGIQDVAALLPIIGTEQCETHVGSALERGYLYAAATPLSIFGSLGIVKAGVSVLFSSISISIPKLSISFHNFKPRVVCSHHRKWLGAKSFRDAGFKLSGTVASLIGMDEQHFRAETRLLEILEEKHIDAPEKISVNWKSRQWNTMLVFLTILSAALSLAPYLALFLGPGSWRPTEIHLAWLFPALRIAGSCIATVTCQFLLQSRAVSLMKNRILFMCIDRRLKRINKAGLDAWLKDADLEWDPDLPSEQCLWSLEKVLLSFGPLLRPSEGPNGADYRGIVEQDGPLPRAGVTTNSAYTSIPMNDTNPQTPSGPSSALQSFSINDFYRSHQEHFPSPTRNAALTVFLWITLGLSLPAAVAGYVGCFTLIGAIPTPGNGPLVWVGLEAALSILRIVIWATNPSFDEETGVTLGLQLAEHQPMVTTDDCNLYIDSFNCEERRPFTLFPEREFLERITPFTGPLDRFQKADTIAVYFTLTGDTGRSAISQAGRNGGKNESLCLLMTVFDFNMEIGVTMISFNDSFSYFDVLVKYNAISRRMEADIQSERRETHPWRMQDDHLFDSLIKYYRYIVCSFCQRATTSSAILPWKWDLSKKFNLENRQTQTNLQIQSALLPSLTFEDRLYLDRGYEHHLKTRLIAEWSQWLVKDMCNLRSDAQLDCHEARRDMSSEKATWELTEVDVQLGWEWARRELLLLELSVELEDILRAKMKLCTHAVNHVREDIQLITWMSSEFESGRQKRMEQERRKAKERMEKAMRDASGEADRDGRPWKGAQSYVPKWTQVIELIDKQWWAEIYNQSDTNWEIKLNMMIWDSQQGRRFSYRPADDMRRKFVEKFSGRVSHKNWRPQQKFEEQIMKATVKRIRIIPIDCPKKELDTAYEYSSPDEYATSKFVILRSSSSKGKACSAIAYDAWKCDKEAVYNVAAKKTTQTIVGVEPEIVASIAPNDHLLFLRSRFTNGKEAEEPAFVQQNRDRWWKEQTANSFMFYFTPLAAQPDGLSCYARSDTIARILIFLCVPSAVRIRVLHCGESINVSIQEKKIEHARISKSLNDPYAFQSHDFKPFMLLQGRHELELVPHLEGRRDFWSMGKPMENVYCLRDILVEFSDPIEQVW